ncbi:MAG: peptidase M49 [Bryobacteraceae bacterium]
MNLLGNTRKTECGEKQFLIGLVKRAASFALSMRAAPACVVAGVLLAGAAFGQPSDSQSSLVDRVGSTGFVQLRAESFHSLSMREQALAYWLTQASIAIDPIIYDQLSTDGLTEKRILEAIVAHPQGIAPETMRKILAFTKLFWANRGNHNEMTAQKFLPEFTFGEFKAAALLALRNGATGIGRASELPGTLDAIRPALFDANFEPMVTAKSPQGGLDILQASGNNFYSGVKLSDLKGFVEHYPLNSRLVKAPDGGLTEQVYRAGTPGGSVPPGLYAVFLKRANDCLAKAAAYADPPQATAIADLVRYYQTGDPKDWIQFDADWVRNNATVDFVNGFIEVYRDARGAKGTSQSFVSITDSRMSALMLKIAGNAQYFENRAPWAAQYKKQNVKPPVAKAVETVIETGDFHVNTIGDNLPNENEIHEKYGSKSFLFTGSTRALAHASGFSSLEEFAYTPAEIERGKKYGDEAEDLMTALHEIIGHGSGKLDPKLTHEAAFYLKEYFSTLEEARADLMALWNVNDPKLRELGALSSPEVAKAMYDSAARAALTQLRRIPKGDTIEEDHQRDRQLIVNYIMAKTGGIARADRNGKTYFYVRDYGKMRDGAGMLLTELMRIKAEGDYAAIKALVESYGVHFDPKLRDQVVARYRKLNLPTYWAGINPELKADFGVGGAVKKVEISYPRDVVQQYLGYGQ